MAFNIGTGAIIGAAIGSTIASKHDHISNKPLTIANFLSSILIPMSLFLLFTSIIGFLDGQEGAGKQFLCFVLSLICIFFIDKYM